MRLRRDAAALADVLKPSASSWSSSALSFAGGTCLSGLGALADGADPENPILVALFVIALCTLVAAGALRRLGKGEREHRRASLDRFLEDLDDVEQRARSFK
jgi:hypothetical protein